MARSEFQIISDFFAPLASAPGAYGLTDDAAVLDIPEAYQLVVTSDTIISGVHFLDDDPPYNVACKALRVNLSDLAAMGATPFGFFLACSFPKSVSEDWIACFAEGLARDASTFGLSLMGGDTTATPGKATFTITALGLVPRGQALCRRGAKAGDQIVVTGSLGDAALGLGALCHKLPFLSPEHTQYLTDRYHFPQPRLRLPESIRPYIRAALDISDGLLQDLGHICALNGLGATIDSTAFPLSSAARACIDRDASFWEYVVSGGDDYELLCAVDPHVSLSESPSDFQWTRIGCFESVPGCRVLGLSEGTCAFEKNGFQHF